MIDTKIRSLDTETPQIVKDISTICGVEFKRLSPGNYVAQCLTNPETRALHFRVREEDPSQASIGYDFTIGEKISSNKMKDVAWVCVTVAESGFTTYAFCPKAPCDIDFKSLIAAILEAASFAD